MFSINFENVSLADKPVFDRFFQEQYYEGSECNFTTLYMWRKSYAITWTVEEDFLFISAAYDGEAYVLPPYGRSEAGFIRAIDRIVAHFATIGRPFVMRGVSPVVAERLQWLRPGIFELEPRREVFDYVYRVQDLIELKGRKYHNKVNHINNFKREFSHYQYLPLSQDLVPACVQNELEWCAKRECEGDPSLAMEKEAILDALHNFALLAFKGGVIMIDGKVEAFTLGEQLNTDTVLVHVEKGNPDIRGIYPLINQEFLRDAWSHLEYVNREEDLGIEGLRTAKESYRPIKMIEKYVATLKQG